MKYLGLVAVIVSTICVVAVVRSASLPETKVPESQNVIILEVASAGGGAGSKAVVEGDKFFLEGKNFTNLKEMINILDEVKKGKEVDSGPTPKPFSIVVPIARNFSSLKELFDILREDASHGAPIKTGAPANLTFVKSSEAKESEYTLFFTD